VLDVLARPLVSYQISGHLGETQHLVKLPNRQRASVCGYLRSPEFQPQAAVEKQPDASLLSAPNGFLPPEVSDGQYLAS